MATYAILFLPLALVSIHATINRCSAGWRKPAAPAGSLVRRSFRRCLLPLAEPGLGTAAAIVFISVVELQLTARKLLLMAPISTGTLRVPRSGPTPRRWLSPQAAPYAALP